MDSSYQRWSAVQKRMYGSSFWTRQMYQTCNPWHRCSWLQQIQDFKCHSFALQFLRHCALAESPNVICSTEHLKIKLRDATSFQDNVTMFFLKIGFFFFFFLIELLLWYGKNLFNSCRTLVCLISYLSIISYQSYLLLRVQWEHINVCRCMLQDYHSGIRDSSPI